MFTGLIEEIGTVESVRKGGGSFILTIRCRKVLGQSGADISKAGREGFDVYEAPTAAGDSIAVNGICLTVTGLTGSTFTADVMPETLSRTSLAGAKPGTRVDLERAMPAYGRFGGHIVSGHIDGTGRITDVRKDGNAVWYTIAARKDILDLIVEKGSVAVDGISLTVAKVSDGSFSVSIIPHTIEETILPDKRPGSVVNLETDVVGKYVRKMLSGGAGRAAGEGLVKTAGAGKNSGSSDEDRTKSGRELLDLL